MYTVIRLRGTEAITIFIHVIYANGRDSSEVKSSIHLYRTPTVIIIILRDKLRERPEIYFLS